MLPTQNLRRICIVTGTRAEYGLLRSLMLALHKAPDVELQIFVTGAHLAEKFGFTYREIEKDGLPITATLDMELLSDTPAGITRSMGVGLQRFAEAYEQWKPDMVIILGDRFEMLVAATAAMVARIPIAHLHGGERTEGAMDEAIRHAISKMAQLHFVADEESRRRVIQLGEQPETVHCVGGLGVDAILRTSLLERPELERALGYRLTERFMMVIFHPVTLEKATASQQLDELLSALDTLTDTQLIFIMPNADTHSRVLFDKIAQYASSCPNAHAHTSLPHRVYLSCVSMSEGIVGNSSSGLHEAPSFKKGSVNIGDRQRGRLKAQSVIDCVPERKAIVEALEKLQSAEFRASLVSVVNPYGKKGTVEAIVKVVTSVPLEGILKKQFYDLNPS